MADITKSIDVNVPVRTAYDQWTQFESFPKFMEGVKSVRQLDNKRLHWVVDVNGKTQEWDAEITEQIPDEKIAWKSISGQPNSGVVTFNRLGPDETRVTLQIEWQPEGVTENIGSMLGFDDRQVDQDLKNFKEFIEARGAPTGAWRGQVNQTHTS
ncbi:MAG TPA: SRPBCC family protein [Chloroflexota bacterium]|nr:SRPBCC family protein [Chloroflexota bacterium]